MTRERVREGVERSRRRLGAPCIDLLQLHWWQYEHPGYVDALRQIAAMQREGLVRGWISVWSTPAAGGSRLTLCTCRVCAWGVAA